MRGQNDMTIGIKRPSTVAATDETFKKVPESKKKHGEQSALGL